MAFWGRIVNWFKDLSARDKLKKKDNIVRNDLTLCIA